MSNVIWDPDQLFFSTLLLAFYMRRTANTIYVKIYSYIFVHSDMSNTTELSRQYKMNNDRKSKHNAKYEASI